MSILNNNGDCSERKVACRAGVVSAIVILLVVGGFCHCKMERKKTFFTRALLPALKAPHEDRMDDCLFITSTSMYNHHDKSEQQMEKAKLAHELCRVTFGHAHSSHNNK